MPSIGGVMHVLKARGDLEKEHRIYGGDGSHWKDCHESHWDCLMKRKCPMLSSIFLDNVSPTYSDMQKAVYEIRELLERAYP